MKIRPEDLPQLLELTRQHHPLTPRELEVAYWWSQGWGIRQVADQLNLSQSTVREHRRRMRRKIERALLAADDAERPVGSGTLPHDEVTSHP